MSESDLINLQPFLQNDLVRIVPLTENDFDKLYKIASDPLIWTQHPQQDRWKKQNFQSFFDEALASQTAFLVYDQVKNTLIGSTRFYEYDAINSGIAIGYTFLAREYWGGNYNRSLKKLLIDHAFLFVDRVIFHVGVSNLRSQMALLKIGARKTRLWEEGERQDKPAHFEFEIGKEEWLASST